MGGWGQGGVGGCRGRKGLVGGGVSGFTQVCVYLNEFIFLCELLFARIYVILSVMYVNAKFFVVSEASEFYKRLLVFLISPTLARPHQDLRLCLGRASPIAEVHGGHPQAASLWLLPT